MAYFNKCEFCDANLDPGEVCECRSIEEQNKKKFEQLTTVAEDGQLKLGGLCHGCISKTSKSWASNDY